MDKEKEIEEMTDIIKSEFEEWLEVTNCLPKGTSYYYECMGCVEDGVKKLVNAGYGNVKQAVKEFAEKVKEELLKYTTPTFNLAGKPILDFDATFYDRLDSLIKEIYGGDQH